MIWLLDGNVLVALRLDSHVHHTRAHQWFARTGKHGFATCSVTQGTLLRLHMKFAVDRSAQAAWAALSDFTCHPGHTFWDAGFGYEKVAYRLLHSSNQVTDAWLCELARRERGRLATLDDSLARLHSESATLIAR